MPELANQLTTLTVLLLAAGHTRGAQLVFRVDGAEAGAQFGWAVVGISDVDGDGVPDYAVGAPQALGPGGAGSTAGLVRPVRHAVWPAQPSALAWQELRSADPVV